MKKVVGHCGVNGPQGVRICYVHTYMVVVLRTDKVHMHIL